MVMVMNVIISTKIISALISSVVMHLEWREAETTGANLMFV